MILRFPLPTALLLYAMMLSLRLPLERDYLQSTVKPGTEATGSALAQDWGILAFANGAQEELEGPGNILIQPCLWVLILNWVASALLSSSY